MPDNALAEMVTGFLNKVEAEKKAALSLTVGKQNMV